MTTWHSVDITAARLTRTAGKYHCSLRAGLSGRIDIHKALRRQRCCTTWERFVYAARDAYSGMHFRGLHDCSLCAEESSAARLDSSYLNLLIPGVGVVYAAPAAILHYIEEHSYLPPADFIGAVDACPPYGSESHELALRKANLNCPTPLDTVNDEARKHAEWSRRGPNPVGTPNSRSSNGDRHAAPRLWR